MSRWRVRCDGCGADAWIGATDGAATAWCEACQRPATLDRGVDAAACPTCGAPLTTGAPRFVELFGALQHLEAVLAAWAGDPAPLRALLPERPRLLTDLTPPAPDADDAPAVRGALEAVRAGAYRDARERAESALARGALAPRLVHALAIAAERLGDRGAAETAWTRLLDSGEHPVARLARGALRAHRGDLDGAREDLARAGNGREARWNRAALAIIAAVAGASGRPDPDAIARARAEAGEPSAYWSDPTVGRLLWTLLVERASARAEAGADEAVLRGAEGELEHATFWDRALVVHGHAALGHAAACAAAARPLALELADGVLAEPALAGPADPALRAAVEDARALAAASAPAAARAALAPALAREDLHRYRVPCIRCGAGTLGVDEVEEGGDAE